MKRKIIALCLVVVMLGVAVISGTMAYFTDTDEAVNVMTIGSVKIEQHEYERVVNADGTYAMVTSAKYGEGYKLQEFTQAKPLVPAVGAVTGWGTSVNFDQLGDNATGGQAVLNGIENAVDKFVLVENTGKSDAYVRTIIAYEIGTAENAMSSTPNAEKDLIMTAFGDFWTRNFIGETKIDGNNYYVVEYVYAGSASRHIGGILPAGDYTYNSLAQVYMTPKATNEDAEAIDGNKNGTYDILVLSQAVQASGFSDAKTALNEGFGEVTATKVAEWFGDVEIPVLVSTPEDLVDELKAAGAANAGDTVIALASDLDMTGKAWTPIKVDGYHGADIVTIDGQGHTIKGLTAPLFAGGFAGGSGIVIKNLTIADSNIVSSNGVGAGAFIEACDSMDTITLENCHLINSTVTSTDSEARAGGLVGWTSGYSNPHDGPVKTYVTIRDCTVIGNTITGHSSVGAINGHAGASDWTYTTIENCEIKNNTLHSTNNGGWRVGVVVGTANSGEVTINNITESGNTLTQVGKTAPAGQSNLYGRFVPNSTGKLVIDGVAIQ